MPDLPSKAHDFVTELIGIHWDVFYIMPRGEHPSVRLWRTHDSMYTDEYLNIAHRNDESDSPKSEKPYRIDYRREHYESIRTMNDIIVDETLTCHTDENFNDDLEDNLRKIREAALADRGIGLF